jgi:enoyl-CoA hydratase/carnithine racemase
MNERVRVVIADHVATVTLNRAEKRNAVDTAMFEALFEAADSIAANPLVRAVVMHGDGKDFCAGVDISVFGGEGIGATIGERMKPRTLSGANFFQSASLCWRDLPVPVIAALHGSAFGAGFQIAMGADMRYAAPDTRMSIMEIKWGIVPDMGITATLPGILAEDKVRELAYTGRLVDANECLALNLVTGIHADPLAKASAVAAEIAAKSPDAVRAIKKLVSESWRGNAAATLKLEADLQMSVMAGGNQKEAAAANIEKREPVFDDGIQELP